MTNQEVISEALNIMTNTLKEKRELRELEAFKKTVEMLKLRKPDAVVETFCHGTGRELLTENSIITIYKNPSDYPDKFVARIFNICTPTQYISLAGTLEGIMEKMPDNKVFFERTEKDDPVIIGMMVAPTVSELIKE